MIIVKLFGGLGNQLFQYALGRQLSILHNVPLKLDASHFETFKSRKYALGVFNILENHATKQDIARIKGKSFKRFMERILAYHKRSHLCERFFYFDPKVLQSQKNVYLQGHWQSERYFKNIEGILRHEFSFKTKPDAKNKETAEIINSVNAISLHIRRTDYICNTAINQFHGTCSTDYYRQAIKMIAQSVPSPHFFVFSDDLLWAKKNIVLKYPTIFVSHNDSIKDFEDLRLMIQCKHHITANSTFSWWGAWLNNNPNKIIIAPEKWFIHPDYSNKDLIPSGWIKI